MRTYRKVEYTASYEQCVELVCDLCGREAIAPSTRVAWRTVPQIGGHDFDEIRIERKVGAHYSEGGSATVTRFDVCPECWENVIVALFRERGAEGAVFREEY